MRICRICEEPIRCYLGGTLCPKCRGERTAEINRAKRDKHGPAYFDGRHADARRDTL